MGNNVNQLFRLTIVLLLFCIEVNANWYSTFYSTEIGDSFHVEITIPKGYTSTKYDSLNALYYLDESLKFGQLIKSIYLSDTSSFSKTYLTVGIGHFILEQ